MGMDIHLNIIHGNEIIAKEIFDGRNTNWFNKLKDANEGVYEKLPIEYGTPEDAPQEIKDLEKEGPSYFGFRYIKVGDFKEWFRKYKPNVDAGWATTYEKWLIENKGYEPEELPHELPEDANLNDMYFIEYKSNWDDCSEWLYDYLIDNQILDNYTITYCFDW